MEVIIDYNNDKIYIQDTNKPFNIAFDKIKDLHVIQEILEEIFNRLGENNLGDSYLNVILSKYDEDNHIGIGEW